MSLFSVSASSHWRRLTSGERTFKACIAACFLQRVCRARLCRTFEEAMAAASSEWRAVSKVSGHRQGVVEVDGERPRLEFEQVYSLSRWYCFQAIIYDSIYDMLLHDLCTLQSVHYTASSTSSVIFCSILLVLKVNVLHIHHERRERNWQTFRTGDFSVSLGGSALSNVVGPTGCDEWEPFEPPNGSERFRVNAHHTQEFGDLRASMPPFSQTRIRASWTTDQSMKNERHTENTPGNM
jgi:hypothetical protein